MYQTEDRDGAVFDMEDRRCDLWQCYGDLNRMPETSPLPNTGSNDEKERIRAVVAERGLVGAANDDKWGHLLDAMRQRQGWIPSYRYKCVDGPASKWDAEWWYHLPFPMMSVEWFDLCCYQEIRRGALLVQRLLITRTGLWTHSPMHGFVMMLLVKSFGFTAIYRSPLTI